jgi:deoxyadenosine/deoxycytidine kinase
MISIEGNIGSGKSTFLKYLKEHLASDKICFLDEPVDDWLSIVDTNDKNIIERYYDDQKKYAFSFQMMEYISRLSLLKKALQNNTYDYIIMERSLFTDKNVFCKMLYDDNLIEKIEYSIYNK